MSLVRYKNVSVQRSELMTIVRSVPEWVVPILGAVHGTDKVVELGEEFVDRDLPPAREEASRLEILYGRSENEDGSKGIPFVAAVYGQNMMGLNHLDAAMKAAIVDKAPSGAKVVKQGKAREKLADLI